MKKQNLIVLFASIMLIANVSCSQKTKETIELKSKNDSLNWVMGENFANGVTKLGFEIDKEIVLQAAERILDNKGSLFDDKTYEALMYEIQVTAYLTDKKKREDIATQNRAIAQHFIDSIRKTDPTIQQTQSGLYYKIIKEGNGEKPHDKAIVEIHYTGKYISGVVFDNTYGQTNPVPLAMSNLFPGFREGITLMKKGAKYIFYIPDNLAYGDKGQDDIKPGDMVIYEVELLGVKNK